MKKIVLLLTLPLLFLSVVVAQTKFEPGYFIDEQNKRVECFIKNFEWRANPILFIYKTEVNGTEKQGNISSAKEFGINNKYKFVRAKVKIDRSSDQVAKLDSKKEPIWSEEVVFLNTIVLGNAMLYKYVEGVELIRYFYQIGDSEIKQLIYKKYVEVMANPDGSGTSTKRIQINEAFKKQLWDNVRCGSTNYKSLKILKYNEKALRKYFLEFNKCKN